MRTADPRINAAFSRSNASCVCALIFAAGLEPSSLGPTPGMTSPPDPSATVGVTKRLLLLSVAMVMMVTDYQMLT